MQLSSLPPDIQPTTSDLQSYDFCLINPVYRRRHTRPNSSPPSDPNAEFPFRWRPAADSG
ncbi:uncharacterized, partial [Tachysurus ichikawai]